MRTLDLRHTTITVKELLSWAASDSVHIVAENGHEFILEEADEFEREVTLLGNSDKFMSFLEIRSQEEGSITLDELERELSDT
ncbi:MAG: hypothetical protein HY023_09530 [Chloroflexi bacterium]|nr:hypothetical protein [Chloroflexota bacterium]MBI3761095.1 hypothetical protein [Chloroflexota bacterium]